MHESGSSDGSEKGLDVSLRDLLLIHGVGNTEPVMFGKLAIHSRHPAFRKVRGELLSKPSTLSRESRGEGG